MKTQPPSLSMIQKSLLDIVYIPFLAAAVPACLFALLGWITSGLNQPNAAPPIWIVVAMIVVQTLGIISMATVILMRYELDCRRLLISTKGQPHFWRKCSLTVSIASLLTFDILANVSAAFADAEFLALFAVPAFVAYLVFNRIALAVVVQGMQPPNLSQREGGP
jgi:hypothetical protein